MPPGDSTRAFVFRGLKGLTISSIRESSTYYYACAGNLGLFKISKDAIATNSWEYIGLANTEPGTHGVGDVCVFGDEALIIACIENDDSLHAGMLVSRDHGLTWTRTDSALVGGIVGYPELSKIHSVSCIAPHPFLPGLLFCVNDWGSAVFWSQDSGYHWARTTNSSNNHGTMQELAIDPFSPSDIWAGGGWTTASTELQHSSNGGYDWFFVPTSPFILANDRISGFSFGHNRTVFISLTNKVLVSADYGNSWHECFTADSSQALGSVVADPLDPSHVIISLGILPTSSKHSRILEYRNGSIQKIYEINAFINYRMRVMERNKLFLGTSDGVYEGVNILDK